MQMEQLLLISACRLVMLYICAKIRDIISNGIKVTEQETISILTITRGNNSAKMQVE